MIIIGGSDGNCPEMSSEKYNLHSSQKLHLLFLSEVTDKNKIHIIKNNLDENHLSSSNVHPLINESETFYIFRKQFKDKNTYKLKGKCNSKKNNQDMSCY